MNYNEIIYQAQSNVDAGAVVSVIYDVATTTVSVYYAYLSFLAGSGIASSVWSAILTYFVLRVGFSIIKSIISNL